ncbi:MAG: GNAT family N-acetyltransferase, partial [Bacteroidetes bacterium]|nr:GNAT family N-acetyltransferase [Bacteroidota bacterium]
TADKYIRETNNGENRIYIITHHNSPNIMKEIGRLREFTFRAAGGGTGESIDIDEYDTVDVPYKQLIVWNEAEKEIVGGYRFIKCKDAPIENGIVKLSTTTLFNFSEKFVKEYVPSTIELGRSFVQPKFQPTVDNRKGLFSLDNLWDGLGAIIIDNPDIKHYYGKVTMYTDFNIEARDMILSFMNYYFPDKDKMVVPIKPVLPKTDTSAFLKSLNGLTYKEGHRILTQSVRALGEHVPPMVNAYMNLSSTMKSFGTALNDHFGEVEETGILVTIADIYESKMERHVATYKK